MSTPTRLSSHGLFFVSTQCAGRRRLFQVEAHAQLFVATLLHYRRAGNYKLYGYVVMPDHVHLLLMPTGVTLERSMMLIKGGYSHRLGSTFPVWQRGFTDHRVRDKQDFVRHREYLHHNPVRAGLCQLPEDWRWSSAWRGQAHLSG